MVNIVYQKVREFKRKYPWTIAWRLRANSSVINMHLNPGEEVLYAFAAQKGESMNLINTFAVALTNKRILLGQKRLLFGYFYTAVTPDMFNDLKVSSGLIWGKVYIDTIKEFITLSTIQNAALIDIETAITEYMMEEKRKYMQRDHNCQKDGK